MFRWHRRTCRKADINVIDGLVFCSSCDSTAESLGFFEHHDSTPSKNTRNSQQSLDLRWPLSVQYSTDGCHDSCNSQSSPTATKFSGHELNTRKLERLSLKDTVSDDSPRLDGKFYSPLAQKYDIRLLKLSTSPSGDHIRGELEVVDLVYSRSFEALSYTWAGETGNNLKPKNIYIGPFWDVIPITENCDSALRLLLSKGHLDVWVDSICINQQDPYERSHQVSIMREIFSKASQVLIYLGPATSCSDDAMEALNSIARLKPQDPPFKLSDTQEIGLRNLFERRYFFRIWVIQEVAMARRVTLYCGDKGVSWESFGALRIPSRYTRDVPWLLNHGQGVAITMAHPDQLLQLLDATSNCAASDPRDNVFAVLGLLRDGVFEGLIPDYLLSREQVYIGVASYLIIRHNKTDLLSYPKRRPGLLPTWIPDWSLYRPPIIPTADDDDDINSNKFQTEEAADEGSLPRDDACFRIGYSDGRNMYNNEDPDITWLKSDHTVWTLFTTNEEEEYLCIRYSSRQPETMSSSEKPTVNASTGSLSIRCHIVTTFASFRESTPCSFERNIPFPGTTGEFKWIVKTDSTVVLELDAVAHVPGCSSYLHLRKDPESNHYNLVGNCRMGFCQGPLQTAKSDIHKIKFDTLQRVAWGRVTNIEMFGDALATTNLLCTSYGMDRSFLKYLLSLRQSRLGKFVVSYLEGEESPLDTAHISGIDKYLDERYAIEAIWKTNSGWKAAVHRYVDSETVKDLCNVVSEQLKLWLDPMIWRTLDAVETCMSSLEELGRIWSDWNQIARVLAAIDREIFSSKKESQEDSAAEGAQHQIYTYADKIGPDAASRLGLPADGAPLSSLIAALAKLTTTLMKHLEFERGLFDRLIPGMDCAEEGNVEKLSPSERVQLGRIYTNFTRNESRATEHAVRDPLVSLGTETFCSMVESRFAILRWLSPSWKSYQKRLGEFGQICQHISAVDTFQGGISTAQRIVIS
ncbi:HET-domain-containing protein [Hypomontagnella monticulosa]|nr:HET-domain-containing protein [Hypomontagnella monticulosa]